MTTATALADTVWDQLDSPQVTDYLNVYDGKVPPGAGQVYAAYYPSPGSVFGDRHGGGYKGLTWSAYIVVTGRTRHQVIDATERIRSALTGWWPDLSDAACPLEEDSIGAEITEDEDGKSLSFTLRYTLTTNRS